MTDVAPEYDQQQTTDKTISPLQTETLQAWDRNTILPTTADGNANLPLEYYGFPSADELLGSETDPAHPGIDHNNYTIDRGGEPFGQVRNINYDDGSKVSFDYDDGGNVTKIADSTTGVVLRKVGDDKWEVDDPKELKVRQFDGHVSVDQSTGAIVTKMQDGTEISVQPNGRSAVKDSDGKVLSVSDPNRRVSTGDGQFKQDPFAATFTYTDGQLSGVSDNKGNVYKLGTDGQWYQMKQVGATVVPEKVPGTIRADEYGYTIETETHGHRDNPPRDEPGRPGDNTVPSKSSKDGSTRY